MGIGGLLPLVTDAFTDTCLTDPWFKGKRVGIDVSIYLYRGILRIDTTEVKENIKYCCNLISLLQDNGMIPLFVFDGRRLPAKAPTHAKRDKALRKLKENAQKLKQEEGNSRGQGNIIKADELLLDIKNNDRLMPNIPLYTQLFMDYLMEKRIDFIVAPYEADAQLASLCKEKIIDIVLTEDSDLIVYGCRRIIYKLDSRGFCRFYNRENLHEALEESVEQFDFSRFMEMCILSGCDYLPNLRYLGLQSARKLSKVAMKKNIDICEALEEYSRGRISLSDATCSNITTEEVIDYQWKFVKAKLTFHHQTVFSFINKEFKHLSPLPPDALQIDTSFLGDLMEDVDNFNYIWGNIQPHSLFEKNKGPYNPTAAGCPRDSIWSTEYIISSSINSICPAFVHRPIQEKKKPNHWVTCEDCGHTFHYSYIHAHFNMVHNNIRPFLCDICGLVFGSSSNLTNHMVTHGTDYAYHCQYEGCQAKFHRSDSLKVHASTHTQIKLKKCNFTTCEATFNLTTELQHHIYSEHYKILPYECSYKDCEERFSSPKNRVNHETLHRPTIKLLECSVCGFNVDRPSKLERHMLKHSDDKNWECDICKTKFKKNSALIRHKKNIHSDKLWTCHVCKRNFRRSDILKNHKCKQFYKCFCKKTFKTKLAFDNHGKTSHKHLKCESCGHEWLDPIKFRDHTRRCDKKLICKKCDRSFFTRNRTAFKNHISSCTGQSRYIKCKHCNKTFYSTWYLKQHVKKCHADKEGKLTCLLCGEVKWKLDQMVTHMWLCKINKKVPKID